MTEPNKARPEDLLVKDAAVDCRDAREQTEINRRILAAENLGEGKGFDQCREMAASLVEEYVGTEGSARRIRALTPKKDGG